MRIIWLVNLLLITTLFFNGKITAQDKAVKIGTIAFYNLENLFDTIDSPDTFDEEYLPDGKNKWNTEKYNNKLEHMSKVISMIGKDITKDAPAVIGVSEVENRTVLEDLVKTDNLKKYNYEIVHYDSPDERGVDVGLLYQPKYFTPKYSHPIHVTLPDTSDRTRDILMVYGLFDNEPMYFFVNHWPSRRGGEKASAPGRDSAALTLRKVCDTILIKKPDAKIFIMGDLNDDPTNESLIEYLKASDDKKILDKNYFFNPMKTMHKKGIGTLAYRDNWNLFDQIIMSPAVINDKTGYHYFKAGIFNKDFLFQSEGKFKGYPFRTQAGGVYLNGYSDHLPVYVYIIKELN